MIGHETSLWARGVTAEGDYLTDFFGFEDIENEMSRMLNLYNSIRSNIPKELVREYKTENGDIVREVGPIVYGYSMKLGPDGKPRVREFGNLKTLTDKDQEGEENFYFGPKITTEREPLTDVNSTDWEVKAILEIPGVKKEDIKIRANETSVEVHAHDSQRKYHKIIDLPHDIDINTGRFTYNNGILEVTFVKSIDKSAKGKDIKIHWTIKDLFLSCFFAVFLFFQEINYISR